MVEYFSYLGHTVVGVEELPPPSTTSPPPRPRRELPALADCPREDARFVLEQLYEADQAGRSLGREAIPRRRPGGGAPLLPAGGAAHPGRAGPGGPGAGEPRPGRHPPHPGRAGPCAAGRRWRAERKWFDQFDRFFLSLTSLNAPCCISPPGGPGLPGGFLSVMHKTAD